MSAPSISMPAGPGAGRLPVARCAGLAGLLVAELLALTWRYDTGGVARRADWWAGWIGHSGYALHLAAVAAVATLYFQGARLRAELRGLDGMGRAPHAWRAYLAVHLAAMAGFAALTATLMGGPPGATGGGGGLALAWVATGLVALAAWGAALVPPGAWWPLARRGGGALATGVAIGALAWLAGKSTADLWLTLSRSTFAMTSCLLGQACGDVVSDPRRLIIGTAKFRVWISPACSGYEGIGLLWVFLAAYFWMARRELRFPRALLLVPLATAAHVAGELRADRGAGAHRRPRLPSRRGGRVPLAGRQPRAERGRAGARRRVAPDAILRPPPGRPPPRSRGRTRRPPTSRRSWP